MLLKRGTGEPATSQQLVTTSDCPALSSRLGSSALPALQKQKCHLGGNSPGFSLEHPLAQTFGRPRQGQVDAPTMGLCPGKLGIKFFHHEPHGMESFIKCDVQAAEPVIIQINSKTP